MKKEELIQAIDNIKPDIHMKTRLKAKIFTAESQRIKSRKTSKKIVALCLAVSLLFSAALLIKLPQSDTTQYSEGSQQCFVPQIMKAFVFVASAAEGENLQNDASTVPLELNEEYPFGVHLKITDISSLSKEEKAEVLHKLTDELSSYTDGNGFSLGRSMTCGTDDFYLTVCLINEFRLDPENSENIKSVTVTNTSEYAHMVYDEHKPVFRSPESGNCITVNIEDFDSETAGFYWNITEETVKTFEENINLPYSAFNDTITFTVDYIDGSKATAVVELKFDDGGNASAVCTSYEYAEVIKKQT